ncbi:hypothetical protein [uncultured Enterovirga sp.]|uniref:hypothetical protein n=1 Tax=uncultured Enterovirga sp. TaxID=2026352 RepID=UPI0035C961A4
MKTVAIAAVAILFGTAAMAQSSSTTIQREEGPLGDRTTVIKKESDDLGTTRSRVDTTGNVGCDTKSVTRTNEDGDSKTKTTTRC